ncbi:Ig-like domain repeat protein [Methanobrevibacter gottschalkii]|uniref:Ig-like domain repeat protein n=1 Tax=Methanobrevibacter gottschalkii TaxID=190974 RepID=UPI0038D22228
MNKKILILLLIAILTFSVATVSASDNTTDDSVIDSSNRDVVSVDDNNVVSDEYAVNKVSNGALADVNGEENVNNDVDMVIDPINNVSVLQGDNVDVNITVKNIGENNASNVTVNFELPDGFSLIDSNNVSDNTWHIGDLQSSKSTNITVKLNNSGINNGDYVINLTLRANEGIEEIFKQNVTVNVIKKLIQTNLTIDFDKESYVYGDDVGIDVKLPDDATGNVTIKINGTENNASINEVLILSNLTPGNYEVNVTYSGDDKYNGSSGKARFTISKANTTAAIDIVSIKVDEELNITINYDSEINGNATIYVDNIKNQTIEIIDGNGNVTINGLSKGMYDIKVAFDGNDCYNSSETNKTIEISKNTVNMLINVGDIVYGNDLVINLKLPDNLTSNVTVSLGDINRSINCSGNVTFKDMNAGNYTAIVSYGGDENYFNETKYVDFKIYKASTQTTVNTSDINMGGVLNVSVDPKIDGTATVYLNGTKYSDDIVMVNGSGNVVISNLIEGTYNVLAVFNGNDNYNSSLTNKSIKVSRNVFNITVNVTDVCYGQDVIINITLPGDVTNTVDVVFGYNSQNINLENGVGTVKFSDLDVGNYNATVIYYGDAKYLKSTQIISFNVTKAKPTVDVNISGNKLGQDLVINIALPSDVKNNVTVGIDNISQDVKVTNGVGKAIFKDLTIGEHVLIIDYSGDSNYLNTTEGIYFNVSKAIPVIDIDVKNIYVKGKEVIDIALPDDATGSVTIFINGVEQKTVNDNISSIVLTKSGLAAGTYNVMVSYTGDSKYESANTTVQFKVSKYKAKLTASSKTYNVKVKTKYYYITLKNNKNKVMKKIKVYLKVNGVTYSATTNSYGKASFKLSKLTKKGTYDALITYKGTSYYNKLTKKVTIAVKATPKLTAYSAKLKKSVNAKKYSVTLRTDKYKAMKYTKVTLKVNGKIYTVKTNSLGKATFKITNLNKKAKFLAVISYSGSKYYYSATKKVILTVR